MNLAIRGIDARKLGTMADRVHRELLDATSRRSPAPTTPGAVIGDCPRRGLSPTTPTCPVSASAPRWRTSASTATCSRPAATSAPRPPRILLPELLAEQGINEATTKVLVKSFIEQEPLMEALHRTREAQ